MVAEIILFISVLLITSSLIIYPLVTLTFAALRKKKISNSSYLPTISVLMPMHNEEKVAVSKIESLLSLNYPDDKKEIILGSDSSTDDTESICERYAGNHNNIRFIRSDKRVGKASMLNMMAQTAQGEILVVTDANVIPAPDCFRFLAGRFEDKKTGICEAWPVSRAEGKAGIAMQEKTYSSIETRLKNAECNAWGTSTGPYGGLYAIRKSLFPEIPGNILVDDLYAGLSVMKKGYNIVNEERAVVIEDVPSDTMEQFRRRIRIATGSFQNLFHWGPFPFNFFSVRSVVFFLHKVVRWFMPVLLSVCFMTTVILSGQSDFYLALVFGQVFFLILPMLDILLLKAGITIKPLRYLTQFLMMNAALLAGMIKAIKGVKEGIWEPTQRV